ncbi:MAG: WecB/TagA/CpsF family glycosyltransferase [Candidatus Falkowbacteria bacterium]
MEQINILGINIIKASRQDILKKIYAFLNDSRQYQVVTPNPEIILAAVNHDQELFYILNKAAMAVPDGVALKFAAWFLGENITRITGADLTIEILRLAEEKNKRVMIFNWRGGLSKAEEIKSAVVKKFSGLDLLVEDIDRQAPYNFTRAMQFSPDIIFSTLGAPYQEKFIFHNLAKLPSAKIGLGVGGAFDFLTGRVKRAPKIFRLIGLEWLWRLIKQPWRWKRIYNAVIVFPIKFVIWRFKKI